MTKLKQAVTLCVMLVVAVAQGCREHTPHTHLIVVLDLTRSIEPDARREAFAAVEAAAKRLRRGDALTVIPVTGDSDAQGKTLRFRVNETREAYDADLRRLAERIRSELKALAESVEARPYARSDILGAVRAAGEAARDGAFEVRAVVVLSDFLQDDPQFDFRRDSRLGKEDSAKALAKTLGGKQANRFAGAGVFLGSIRSADIGKVPRPRRDAIAAFWVEYFRASGAWEVAQHADGSAALADLRP